MTTYAVLEIAENVFNVGSGFTKLDMRGFTLNKIKKIVESIEEKMDIILRTPLKIALDYLTSATTLLMQDIYEDAYDKLETVEMEATRAFHYISQDEKSTGNLRECISALKLLVFSKLMRYSYDKEKKVFLPYRILKRNVKLAICEELEKLVNDCLEQSEMVKNSKWFLSKSKETKITDSVDLILTMTYPYISEGKGWTSFTTEIAEDSLTSVEVTVKPQYVPSGEEDETEVIIGTRKGEVSCPIRVKMWRTRGCVVLSSPFCKDKIKFSSLEDEVSKTVEVQGTLPTLVISSLGVTAEGWAGKTFGQYEYRGLHNGYPSYRQRHSLHTSTELLYYIYRGNHNNWWVGWCLGQEDGDLYNESTSYLGNDWSFRMLSCVFMCYHVCSVPQSGWRCYDGDWRDDPQLTVVPGELDSCETVTISGADKYQRCNGDYVTTGQYSRGVRVFKHSSRDLYLCCMPGNSYWWVTDHIEDKGPALYSHIEHHLQILILI